MKLLVTLLLLPCISFGQLAFDASAGMTSRLGPSIVTNVGLNLNGPTVQATAGMEFGFGANVGAIAGWQFYSIKFYGGYGRFFATNKLLEEGTRNYAIAGITYQYPESKGTIDLRYMGDAIHLTFGISLNGNRK